MKMLEGKNIFVTGTARGMGKRMVQKFAEHGANIFAHARKHTDEHETFCRETESLCGVKIFPLYFDLTDGDAIKDAIKTIRGMKIPVDGLVNNAGIGHNLLFQMTPIDDVHRQMDVNFFAPYLLTQYISKLMVRGKKGSIVNISSTSALDGNSGKTSYGAAKAALLTMTLAISEELGMSGIRANVICPGVTDTDMIGELPEYVIRSQTDATSLGRIASTDDVANTALYLLSDYSSYITGQVFRVDGGVTAYEKRKRDA